MPIYAVEEGSALTGDGRILCLKCRAPAPRADRRLLVLLVVAAAAAAAGVVIALAMS